MGYARVLGTVANPLNHNLKLELDFLVDTGAVYTVISKSTAGKIGLKEADKRKFKTGSGAVELPVAEAYIVIDGAGHALQGNGTSVGFFLQGRKNVTVRNVRISNFTYGIALVPDYESWPSFNYEFVIQGNTIANTTTGIFDLFAKDVTVSGNILRDNENGVFCWDTENLIVCGNSILRNGIGIKILDCQGSIYQNNFINNTLQINSDGGVYGNDPSAIVWHNGRKGNYWSDYNGTDANHDGVGDAPHIFDVDYVDEYPLMYPWGASTHSHDSP